MKKLIKVPQTNFGKWTLWSMMAQILSFAIFFLFVLFGEKGGATFFSNLKLSIPFLIAFFMAIVTAFLGVVAISKKKERSASVVFSVVVSTLVSMWILAELLE